jgi:hypothetical protein
MKTASTGKDRKGARSKEFPWRDKMKEPVQLTWARSEHASPCDPWRRGERGTCRLVAASVKTTLFVVCWSAVRLLSASVRSPV